MLRLSRAFVASFLDQDPVNGLTHDFYRYPARFSPQFAGAAIKEFTRAGDLVVDPFMGGGTSLVEAFARHRRSLGSDINQLASFVARVKTTPLSGLQQRQIASWLDRSGELAGRRSTLPQAWKSHEYLTNLGRAGVWPIRDAAARYLGDIHSCPDREVRDFLRCVVLRVSQWAIDGRRAFPTVSRYRGQLQKIGRSMLQGVSELCGSVESATSPLIFNLRAQQLSREPLVKKQGTAALVLTSPPYPRVHVVYHRWQLCGGLETPAPFWIANCRDGHGEAHYTFGHRSSHGAGAYFERLTECFRALVPLASARTLFVQVVGFSQPRKDIRRYLAALDAAGLREMDVSWHGQRTRRLWRGVPNRRWYNWQRHGIESDREVAIFHQLA